MRTDNLRRQHDAAMGLAAQISAAIAAFGDRPDRRAVVPVTILLARLTGLLKIHFAQEDCHLYPSLMASGQGGVAEVARRFAAEMGQIGPAYAAFVERWHSADTILSDTDGFRHECSALFKALGERIAREDAVLYPLADALCASQAPPRAA